MDETNTKTDDGVYRYAIEAVWKVGGTVEEVTLGKDAHGRMANFSATVLGEGEQLLTQAIEMVPNMRAVGWMIDENGALVFLSTITGLQVARALPVVGDAELVSILAWRWLKERFDMGALPPDPEIDMSTAWRGWKFQTGFHGDDLRSRYLFTVQPAWSVHK